MSQSMTPTQNPHLSPQDTGGLMPSLERVSEVIRQRLAQHFVQSGIEFSEPIVGFARTGQPDDLARQAIRGFPGSGRRLRLCHCRGACSVCLVGSYRHTAGPQESAGCLTRLTA